MLEREIWIEQSSTTCPGRRVLIHEAHQRRGSVAENFGIWIEQEDIPRVDIADCQIVRGGKPAVLLERQEIEVGKLLSNQVSTAVAGSIVDDDDLTSTTLPGALQTRPKGPETGPKQTSRIVADDDDGEIVTQIVTQIVTRIVT